MTYDKQDLLLDLRKIKARLDGAQTDQERAHERADELLIRYIDDEHITAAYEAIPRWYA